MSRARSFLSAVVACLPLMTIACGSSSGGGSPQSVTCTDGTMIANEANDYSFTSSLMLHPVKVKPMSDLTFNWGLVTKDFLGQTVKPATDLNAIFLLLVDLPAATFAPQLIWLALTFGLIYLVLKRVVLPRVGEVIEERSDRIKRDLAQAEKLKADTQKALGNYEQALSDARAKAGTIAKTMRDKLTTEVDKERAKVEAQITAKLAEAEKRIAETKSYALASVGDIASEVAGVIVTRLIGKEVTKDEVKRALVQRAAE